MIWSRLQSPGAGTGQEQATRTRELLLYMTNSPNRVAARACRATFITIRHGFDLGDACGVCLILHVRPPAKMQQRKERGFAAKK